MLQFWKKWHISPRQQRGGGLVRPKYFHGDRGGKQTFPSLRSLSYSLDRAFGEPHFKWGWITPNLTTLNLMLEGLFELRGPHLDQWIRRDSESLCSQVIKSCPKLTQIDFVYASKADKSMRMFPLMKMEPPPGYDVIRLILIGHFSGSTACCFQSLPLEIVKVICQLAMTWTATKLRHVSHYQTSEEYRGMVDLIADN